MKEQRFTKEKMKTNSFLELSKLNVRTYWKPALFYVHKCVFPGRRITLHVGSHPLLLIKGAEFQFHPVLTYEGDRAQGYTAPISNRSYSECFRVYFIWWQEFCFELTEDEMVGWHHWRSGHEFEQTPGDSEGQGRLACCRPWSHKELHITEQLNNKRQRCKGRIAVLSEETKQCRAINPVQNWSRERHNSGYDVLKLAGHPGPF